MTDRILVIDLAYLGDIVTMNPALDVIARNYPESKISVATRLGSEIGIKYHPAVDRVITWDKTHRRLGLFRFTRACRTLNREQYRIAFVFHNSFNAGLISFLSNSRYRVGYQTEWRQALLTHSYPLPKVRQHLMDIRLNLLSEYGIDVKPTDYKDYKMNLPFEIIEQAQEKFLPKICKKVILISVAASWPTKTWLPEEMQTLIDKFPEDSVTFILTGRSLPEDHEIASELKTNKNQILNLVGKTSISELAGIVALSDLIITPDNGVMHLASALDRPVVAVFAPTDPVLCGPRSISSRVIEAEVPCTKCYLIQCPRHKECMSTVTADRVWQKIVEINSTS